MLKHKGFNLTVDSNHTFYSALKNIVFFSLFASYLRLFWNMLNLNMGIYFKNTAFQTPCSSLNT